MKAFIKNNLIQILSIIFIMFYPCCFIYCSNVDEINFSEISVISIIFVLIGLILLFIFKFIFKDINKSALFVNIVMLILLNYSFIDEIRAKYIRFFSYYQVLIIIFGIIILFGVYAKEVLKSKNIIYINFIFFITFASLIIYNFAISIPIIIQKNSIKLEYNDLSYVSDSNQDDKSNVYYLIFDELSGPEGLERYCNYNNEDFYKELDNIGFNTSKTSHGETTSTNMILANLFNFDSVVDHNTLKAERIEYIKNPLLYKVLNNSGYDINVIDTIDYLGNSNVKYIYNNTRINKFTSKIADTAVYYILKNTVVYKFMFNYNDNYNSSRISSFINSLKYCANSYELKKSNLFTIFYSTMAHGPWIVDENGKNLNQDNVYNYDWDNESKYLEQLKYTEKNILKTVKEIIKNDPNCIILIQSDHGYRQPFHLERDYGIKMEDPELENYYMTNIINCLYYKGEKIDVEGMTGANTLKLIINNICNTNFQYEELKQTLRPMKDHEF